MTSMKMRMTCRFLVVALLTLTFQTARAGMIGTEQAAGAPTERTMVLGVLDRAETVAQMQAQGIDPQMARERVAAMTDQEVRMLSSGLQTAPAGADGGTAAAVILIGLLVWYVAFRK